MRARGRVPRSGLADPASGLAAGRRGAGTDRRQTAVRLLRASECEQTHPPVGRCVRRGTEAPSEREAPPRRVCIARLRCRPARSGRRRAHRLRRGRRALVSDGGVRRLHLAAFTHDGRDVGERHPRALTRPAARRQRARLVLRVAGRRRPEGARGRRRDPVPRDCPGAARLERADTACDERCGARLRSARARPRACCGELCGCARRGRRRDTGRRRGRRRGRASRRRDRSRARDAVRRRAGRPARRCGTGAQRPARAWAAAEPQSARARPGLGLARRARRPLRGLPLWAVAPRRRAVDHGRRAHLLRARQELRAVGPLPHPRRARRRVRRCVPAADCAGVARVRVGDPMPTPRRRRSVPC